MAKINLAKLMRSLERNSDFKEVLRDAVQGFVPEEKLGRDDVFLAVVKRLESYFYRPIEVSDDLIEIKEK